jgi:hypothetical protein
MSTRLPKAVKDAIASFPGEDGWWHTSSQEDFESIARFLIQRGLLAGDVIDILGRAYGDVANEFGG